MTPLLPENAPFTPEQRAWLSGFFAALVGTDALGVPSLPVDVTRLPLPPGAPASATTAAPADADVAVTWHDANLPLAERMKRADGLSLPLRLYAAMGQQDCGQCGYLCESYAQALFDGAENDANLCSPGGRETRRKLKELLAERDTAPVPVQASVQVVAPGTSRQQPVMARIIESIPLHPPDTGRDTRHVAIELPPHAPAYQPGDALGIFPANDPALVDRLIEVLGAAADQQVDGPDGSETLDKALGSRLDISDPGDETLGLLLESATAPADREVLARCLEAGPEEGTDLLELLEACPSARPDVDALCRSLRRLQPRLYSIASSPDARPGVVELTVGVVQYERSGRPRRGVASGFLARSGTGDTALPVYLQASAHFHLPPDPATPLVMVGPGTGIAPFRGFLQARARIEPARRGPAWLFFGNPHERNDFLYREALGEWLADGTLTRLSTAFSRDQVEKVYVQQRMLEASVDLWQWLEHDGAWFYVCGDAKRMAVDVEAALLRVAGTAGGLDAAAGRRWLDALAASGRYLRDVY